MPGGEGARTGGVPGGHCHSAQARARARQGPQRRRCGGPGARAPCLHARAVAPSCPAAPSLPPHTSLPRKSSQMARTGTSDSLKNSMMDSWVLATERSRTCAAQGARGGVQGRGAVAKGVGRWRGVRGGGRGGGAGTGLHCMGGPCSLRLRPRHPGISAGWWRVRQWGRGAGGGQQGAGSKQQHAGGEERGVHGAGWPTPRSPRSPPSPPGASQGPAAPVWGAPTPAARLAGHLQRLPAARSRAPAPPARGSPSRAAGGPPAARGAAAGAGAGPWREGRWGFD